MYYWQNGSQTIGEIVIMREDEAVYIINNYSSETKTDLAFDPTDPGILRTSNFDGIESTLASPEHCVTIRERTASELSLEAACILKTVLGVPGEITEAILLNSPQIAFPESAKKVNILSKSGNVSKKKVRKFLVSKFNEKYVRPNQRKCPNRTKWPSPEEFISKVMKEVREWILY